MKDFLFLLNELTDVRGDETAEQRAATSAKTKVKTLENSLTGDAKVRRNGLRQIRTGRGPNGRVRQALDEFHRKNGPRTADDRNVNETNAIA